MNRRLLILPALPLALAMLTGSAAVPAAADPSRSYSLTAASDFEVGCFDPCACPILIVSPLKGRFELSPLDTDETGIRYAVSDVAWIAALPSGGELQVSGSGLYRLVSGTPRMHQMTLLLRLNGQLEQSFDSGLVPGGDDFPGIRIQVASGGFFCWDSVFTIDATGTVLEAGNPPGGDIGGRIGFAAAWPNPFRDEVALQVRLSAADRLAVHIHDAAGRLVRTLARDQELPAGLHSFRWDGRRETGSAAPPGVYVVRVRGSGGEAARVVVRLH